MLEILAIWLMGKKAGEIAEDKGYSGVLFTLLFISLWVICEIGGFIIGLNMAGDRNILAAYALALMGALGGGFIGFVTVIVLPPGPREEEEKYDMYGRRIRYRKARPAKRKRPPLPADCYEAEDDDDRPRRRPRRTEYDDEDDRPRRPRRTEYFEDDRPRPRPRRPEPEDDDRPRPRRRPIRDRDDYDD